ncbi:MAG: hypothetical protein EBQ99_10085, partial [Planctomycetes bacterium]|nr:hypothetical protein [Planctomycetota bacterium]
RLQAAQRHLLVWRAASIALAASLLTTLFWSGMYRLERHSIQQLVDNGATVRQLEEQFGIKFIEMLRGSSSIQAVRAVASNVSGSLMLDETSKTGCLMVLGLRQNARYTLRLIDDRSGSVVLSSAVTGGAGVTVARLDGVNRASLAGHRIELLDETGSAVLSDAAA